MVTKLPTTARVVPMPTPLAPPEALNPWKHEISESAPEFGPDLGDWAGAHDLDRACLTVARRNPDDAVNEIERRLDRAVL